MLKVAAIQVGASADRERNLAKALQFLEVAVQRGARVACFPELFCAPWFLASSDAPDVAGAQPPDGELGQRLMHEAQRLGVALVGPFFEQAAEGVYHNSALVIDSRGERTGLYRKVHLPQLPSWREKEYFTPGPDGFPVFEVDGVRVGVQLGWDSFFPEGFRCLALGGAQVVFVATAAAFASQERWLAMCVSHAVANGLFVVRVNRVGREAGLDFYGHSFGVRPDGELCAEPIGMNEGILMLDLDLDAVAAARQVWPYLRDRRPREYAALVGIPWGTGLLQAEIAAPAVDPGEEEAV